MSTIGEQMQETPETAHKRMMQEAAAERRAEFRTLAKWGCGIGAAALAVLFGVVYLVTLAVRLGWGS